jgi:hypothetical protein
MPEFRSLAGGFMFHTGISTPKEIAPHACVMEPNGRQTHTFLPCAPCALYRFTLHPLTHVLSFCCLDQLPLPLSGVVIRVKLPPLCLTNGHAMKTGGGSADLAPPLLTSALDGGEW